MNAIQRRWGYALALCLGLLSGAATAKVTIDEAAKEAMAQQLMGKVSGLREMQDGLALAQADIDMLQRKLRVMKQQAELVGSSQLDDLIRRAEIELDSKVARTAAIAEKAGTGEMQPYYKYAMGVLGNAAPLMDGFADHAGEFSPRQQAEKALSLRGAEAAVMSEKRSFYADMTEAHTMMAGVIGDSLASDAPVSTYFDGYFTYAQDKHFVTEDQRDELWQLVSWFMLDYLSEDPPAGQRTILDTMRRMRRGHDDSYAEMMKFIPEEYRATESELGRPHRDWKVVVTEARSDVDQLSKFAFILMQVGIWQTTLLLGNKAIAQAKDVELSGVMTETRTKLKAMGVDEDKVNAALTADEVVELAMDRASAAREDEDASELTQLAVRIHQVAAEFQQATSHATSSEREVKEAAIRGDRSGITRGISAAAVVGTGAATAAAAVASQENEYQDFDAEEEAAVREEDKESGFGIGKMVLFGAALAAGVYFANKYVSGKSFQDKKTAAQTAAKDRAMFSKEKAKATFFNVIDVVIGKGGDMAGGAVKRTTAAPLRFLRGQIKERVPFGGVIASFLGDTSA